ncbi:MAG TPA: mycofactocin precursor MftA [Acidimicrobiales bacterium]|nr:mycofactocin precursor MftA [Acidimicrobiales bacterium]
MSTTISPSDAMPLESGRTASSHPEPDSTRADDDLAAEGQLVEELLVEEISIDGMCGVY